jgi:mono/diheme cytochrome c family protein
MVPNKRIAKRLGSGLALASLLAGAGLRDAGAVDIVRGELLYNTHCVACHTNKMHWRDQRLATDWKSLNVQVRRWENTIQLNWDDDDINNVASYLNLLYYQFQEPSRRKVSIDR